MASLKSKLSGLRYKGIISNEEYHRLRKALDNEGVIDEIIAGIKQRPYGIANNSVIQGMKYERADILEFIDKYKAEREAGK